MNEIKHFVGYLAISTFICWFCRVLWHLQVFTIYQFANCHCRIKVELQFYLLGQYMVHQNPYKRATPPDDIPLHNTRKCVNWYQEYSDTKKLDASWNVLISARPFHNSWREFSPTECYARRLSEVTDIHF